MSKPVQDGTPDAPESKPLSKPVPADDAPETKPLSQPVRSPSPASQPATPEAPEEPDLERQDGEEDEDNKKLDHLFSAGQPKKRQKRPEADAEADSSAGRKGDAAEMNLSAWVDEGWHEVCRAPGLCMMFKNPENAAENDEFEAALVALGKSTKVAWMQ